MKLRNIIIILSFLFTATFVFQRGQKEPIEKLLIIPGIGFDINIKENDNVNYILSIPSYIFEGNNISSKVYIASANTISETRETRQTKIDKRYITGFEKVYILSEDYARYGIRNLIDILQKNSWVNDEGYIIVCKGKAEDIIRLDVKGYPSSSDFLDGMLFSSKSYNFYPPKFALINAFKSLDAEGTEMAMPYIEIKNNQIEMSGLALFKNDKMIAKFHIEDAKIINILRGNNVKGVFELIENSNKYLSYETSVKTKKNCSKRNGKYKFTISLKFDGDIISNELFPNALEDPTEIKKIEKELEKNIKDKCITFIEKMQNEYRVDLINLGYVGAATVGRHKGIDWDEVVSNADITVNVKVNIDKIGRGDY